MNNLDQRTIDKLKRAGMLRGKFADYMQIAVVWRSELEKTGSVMQAYVNTADLLNKTDITVMRAVKAVKKLDD